MSGGHAPYILPDGSRLTTYLNANADVKKGKAGNNGNLPGKHHLWGQLQGAKQRSQLSEGEIAEIRALERLGTRRRARALNDKTLRDMAGSMTAGDMEAQFTPAPFGEPGPPSLFSRAMAPEHAPIWQNFVSVDMDREARVLQRWEEHNSELDRSRSGGGASTSGAAPGAAAAAAVAASPAAAALAAWCGVSRPGRAALKRANVHSVLELETHLLDWLAGQGEQHGGAGGAGSGGGDEVCLDVEDGFGRLLVHALAQYHGLASATRCEGGAKRVVVCHQGGGGGGKGAGGEAAASAAAAAAGAVMVRHPDALMCTDVLMAMHELGELGGFDSRALGRFMRTHLHGSEAMSEDFVMV